MIKLRILLAVAVSLLGTSILSAQTYTETGDAGANLATAQGTGATSGQTLNSISGTILNGLDGDFFYITITDPTMFSATTVGGSSLDTMLFLFTLAGNPVFLNDDAPDGLSLQSNLPVGTFDSLAAGTYILGISLSGAEPINSGNQPLFADGVFSTDIRGPRPGALGPVTGVSAATFSETGPYTINLSGAQTAIPEPSSLALFVGSGLGGLLLLRRRIRRS